jgi:hypothetical protein
MGLTAWGIRLKGSKNISGLLFDDDEPTKFIQLDEEIIQLVPVDLRVMLTEDEAAIIRSALLKAETWMGDITPTDATYTQALAILNKADK